MKALAVFGILLVAALLAPPVSAHDEWEDGHRTLRVETTADGFELRSEHRDGGAQDEVRFRLDGRDVRFRFELSREGNATADAELRVELERVLEFRDANGDGAFQRTEDVRESYDKGDLVLSGLAVDNATSGGVSGLEVAATYAFRDAPASSLVFRATAFGDPTTFQGVAQKPVEVKVDIEFHDFPYTRADTLPGIELRVRVGTASPGFVPDGVSFGLGPVNATFRWKDTATVDGAERPVGTTVVELPGEGGPDETVLSVAFAYARGADIVHDPTFGFSLLPQAIPLAVLGNPVLFAVGALGAAGAFGGLAVLRRGRRVKRP